MTEMLVFSNAEVDHDDNGDSVSRSEYEQYFRVIDDLRLFLVDGSRHDFFGHLIGTHWLFGRSDYGYMFDRVGPRWPYTLPDYPTDHSGTPYLLLLKIVDQVWGGYEIQEDVEAVVGEVNGQEITRFVDVLTRPDVKQ